MSYKPGDIVINPETGQTGEVLSVDDICGKIQAKVKLSANGAIRHIEPIKLVLVAKEKLWKMEKGAKK